jgi:hypothetical protein
VTPAQIKRLRDLPKLIVDERDPEKLKLLATELCCLTSLELDEMRSKFAQLCPTCGIELRLHTAEKLEQCDRKQKRDD